MNDGSWSIFSEQAVDQYPVTDVTLDENVSRVAFQRGEATQVAGIGQGVKIDHWFASRSNPVEYEIRADEAGAACDKNHELESPWEREACRF